MAEQPTSPGWTPTPPSPRRRISDRVLIVIIGAVVTVLEGWRAAGPLIAPPAQAAPVAPETISPERFGRLEEKVGKLSDSMIEVRVKLALKP